MTDEARPALRVVAGGVLSAEELAAVVVALTLRPAPAPPAAPRAAWSDRARTLRRARPHGPERWRWSLR